MRLLLTLLFVTIYSYTSAQKVGVVLSGGGSAGIAHIGVLKALEENEIAIDCITGTSIGALVGGLYASGWSPKKIEELVLSEQFQTYVNGEIDEKHQYFFKRRAEDGSWASFKFSPDTIIQSSLPTNLISPISIDFKLMEFFSQSSAAANYNFDSLFVPFRCVAADIESKSSTVFKNGNLSQAIRASVSYPFFLKPIKVNGKLLFDGGLYDNFPVGLMISEFNPDFIIGSNVSDGNPKADEDNLLNQIKAMIINRSFYTENRTGLIIIEPSTADFSVFDFKQPGKIVDKGYDATIAMMDSIKHVVIWRSHKEKLEDKRRAFFNKQPNLLIDEIYIEGLNSRQKNYAKNILRHHLKKNDSKILDMNMLKPQFFRLASDDKISSIYPYATYNKSKDLFDLNLSIKREKKMIASFGGVFSSKPINTGFVALQYSHLGKIATTIYGNSYFGKLYGSTHGKIRFDIPTSLPLFLETSVTNSRFDYFKSYATFFEDVRPSYLIQNEFFSEITVGVPVYRKGILKVNGSYFDILNSYYQTQQFTKTDTADKTGFYGYSASASYERSLLNRKQFASSGTQFKLSVRFVSGEENTVNGSTSLAEGVKAKYQEWIQFHLLYHSFLFKKGFFRPGYRIEANYSTQSLFNNYKASILMAPAFSPIPESKVLFLDNFRSNQWVSFGVVNVASMLKGLELRIEAFIYQPYQKIIANEFNKAVLSNPFDNRYYIGSSTLVYNTAVGPASVGVNYYNNSPTFDRKIDKYSIIFSFGYVIQNKRALE